MKNYANNFAGNLKSEKKVLQWLVDQKSKFRIVLNIATELMELLPLVIISKKITIVKKIQLNIEYSIF